MLRKILSIIGILVFIWASLAIAQTYRWERFDSPQWVNGIDVAIGPNDAQYQHPWYRYLIGTDGDNKSLFNWMGNEPNWSISNTSYPEANKLISYKYDGLGNIAFCSSYNDKIYKTTEGGAVWLPVPRSDEIANKHFSSIEVPWASNAAGNVIIVASLAQPNLASTYYTTDGGTSWPVIGGVNSPTDLDVYDIEAFNVGTTYAYPPYLSIGTEDGIYIQADIDHDWSIPWTQRAFSGNHVPALETIEGPDMDGPKQIAAKEVGTNGECELYYSGGGGSDPDIWWTAPKELIIDGNSYNKAVRDLAAFNWGSSHVSLYVASDQGVDLLTFDINGGGPTITAIDQELENEYSPLKYDVDVQAVDSRIETGQNSHTLFTLVATKYNIYEIAETRSDEMPGDIQSLTVSEIVEGTYLSKVIFPELPINISEEH